MQAELAGIINILRINHSAAVDLRDKYLSICNNSPDPQEILEAMGSSAAEPDTECDEHRALGFLFKSCLQTAAGDLELAVAEAGKARDEFRCCGQDFNEALTHWFIGKLHHEKSEKQIALAELEEAIRLLMSCASLHEMESDYKRKAECEKHIKKIEKEIRSYSNVGKTPKKVIPTITLPFAQLIYGVYDIGHASRVGRFVWDDSLIGQLSIDLVKFDEVPHRFYNLRDGREIHLSSSGEYRLLRIEGDSMNRAKPLPIHPGDYVLADLNLNPQMGNIVVAGFKNPPTPSERAGVVKRLTGKGLRSESKNEYEDIPLTDVDIRGVVVAIAKPISYSKPKPTKSTKKSGLGKTDYNFQTLLNMAHGDKELSERLIRHERDNDSTISRTEAIARAITKWQRDNT